MTDAAKHGIKGFKAFVRTLGTIKEGASAREKWLALMKAIAEHIAGAMPFLTADLATGVILVYPRTNNPYLREADLLRAARLAIKDHEGALVYVINSESDPGATVNLIMDAAKAHQETSGGHLVGLTWAAVQGQGHRGEKTRRAQIADARSMMQSSSGASPDYGYVGASGGSRGQRRPTPSRSSTEPIGAKDVSLDIIQFFILLGDLQGWDPDVDADWEVDTIFPGVGALLVADEAPRSAQIWALEYSVSRRIIVAARFRQKLHSAITFWWDDLRRRNSGCEHGWPGRASGADAATDEALQSLCEPARILWRGWRRTELAAGRSPGRCIIQGGTLDPLQPPERLSGDFR